MFASVWTRVMPAANGANSALAAPGNTRISTWWQISAARVGAIGASVAMTCRSAAPDRP
jgi:hypothetical protein